MIELRRIRTDEWQVYKELRLASLKLNGEQFGQSYEEVSKRSDEQWQEYTANAAESDDFYVIVAFDQTRPIGISGCIRREDFGKIIMVWVDPQYRGSGIGRLLVDKTMAEAGAPSYKLTVVDGNTPAIRTYERLGFSPTGFAYTNRKSIREIEMVHDRQANSLIRHLRKSPVQFRHSLEILDPEYAEWKPEGRPEHRLQFVGSVPLFMVKSYESCALFGDPSDSEARQVMEVFTKSGLHELSLLGEAAFQALRPHAPDGA